MRSLVRQGYEENDYAGVYKKSRKLSAFEHRFLESL